jgi:hypothetical protein
MWAVIESLAQCFFFTFIFSKFWVEKNCDVTKVENFDEKITNCFGKLKLASKRDDYFGVFFESD